jgi:hypothetical protein
MHVHPSTDAANPQTVCIICGPPPTAEELAAHIRGRLELTIQGTELLVPCQHGLTNGRQALDAELRSIFRARGQAVYSPAVFRAVFRVLLTGGGK